MSPQHALILSGDTFRPPATVVAVVAGGRRQTSDTDHSYVFEFIVHTSLLMRRQTGDKPATNRRQDLRDVSALRGSPAVSLRTYYVGPYGSGTPPSGSVPADALCLPRGNELLLRRPFPRIPHPLAFGSQRESPCRGSRLRRRG